MEIWKEIVYDGVTYEDYQVSNFGRVKSLNYRHTGKEGFLRTDETEKGYLQVFLCKDRKRKAFRVHRLVATAFLENPENKPEVNHIDEDKTNNFVGTPENDYKDGNLKWVWCKENSNHGTRNERISKKLTNGKLSKPVLQFTLDDEFVREWSSTQECGRNGFHQGAVAACCRGELKQYKGFKWKYK